jgi:hypothetical protein
MINNYLNRGDSKISIGGRSIDKLPNGDSNAKKSLDFEQTSSKQIRSRAYKMIEKFTSTQS